MKKSDENLIVGMTNWLPIQEKALETLSEFEKRNEKGIVSHFMSIGEIIYISLVLFHDDIVDGDESSLDSIENIRREYIDAQKKNIKFLTEFGALNKKYEKFI